MEIQWKKAEEFSARVGAKAVDKPFLVITKSRLCLLRKAVDLTGLKEGGALLFGESGGRWFVKRNSAGFKLRADGKGANLIFSSKKLKEQLLDFYNNKKAETLSSGYAPSEACKFLVVEVEEITEARVFELLPIL